MNNKLDEMKRRLLGQQLSKDKTIVQINENKSINTETQIKIKIPDNIVNDEEKKMEEIPQIIQTVSKEALANLVVLIPEVKNTNIDISIESQPKSEMVK